MSLRWYNFLGGFCSDVLFTIDHLRCILLSKCTSRLPDKNKNISNWNLMLSHFNFSFMKKWNVSITWHGKETKDSFNTKDMLNTLSGRGFPFIFDFESAAQPRKYIIFLSFLFFLNISHNIFRLNIGYELWRKK